MRTQDLSMPTIPTLMHDLARAVGASCLLWATLLGAAQARPESAPNAPNAPRFEVLGNGVVQDNLTGLQWTQCTAGQDGSACTNGSPASMTWAQALTYAKQFNALGYFDWRLPSIVELQSLMDVGKYSPTIDTAYFPTPSQSVAWTSTTSNGDANAAWVLNFLYGNTGTSAKTDGRHVRLVRGGKHLSRFVAGSDAQPEAFGFTPQTNVPLSVVRWDGPIFVHGLSAGAVTGIGVKGAASSRYAVGDPSAPNYTRTPGSVVNGDGVYVRHISAATPGTTTRTTLIIGGVSATFTTTTAGFNPNLFKDGLEDPIPEF